MRQGNLFILSGPSGVGKGTVLEGLLKEFKEISYSISATTRKSRLGEIEGKDYFFLELDKFFQMIKEDQFIEWAYVHNNYYGTPRKYVNQTLKEGKDIILEIDIQGAKQIKDHFPEAIFIFLIPPSLRELEKRLNYRGSEDEFNKGIRLDNAKDEMKEIANYDYKIVNDKIDEAVEKLKAIIIAEKCRIKLQK